jgi:hypothetical protein
VILKSSEAQFNWERKGASNEAEVFKYNLAVKGPLVN